MKESIFWILLLVICLVFGIWILGFWVGGCSSPIEEIATTTTNSATTTSTASGTTTTTTTSSSTTTNGTTTTSTAGTTTTASGTTTTTVASSQSLTISGTIHQNESTVGSALVKMVGLDGNLTPIEGPGTSQTVFFTSGTAQYSVSTNQGSSFKIIAIVGDKPPLFFGGVGATTGEVSLAFFQLKIFTCFPGVVSSESGQDFNMYTFIGGK